MLTYSLFQLATHVFHHVERIENEKLSAIKDLIVRKEKWSPYVKSKWEEHAKHSARFQCTDTGDDKWEVRNKVSGKCNIVEFRSPCPSCDCNRFKASLLPCSHICSAITANPSCNEVYDVQNLHPRWRLVYHPLHRMAMVSLGLMAPTGNGTTNSVDDADNTAIAIYSTLTVPKSETKRYNILSQLWKQAMQQAVHA